MSDTLGGWLRHQRQARGIHLAVLAGALKVPLHKLEALEADQLEQLPDAAFVRSLVLSLCRQLEVDPEPVVPLLPQVDFERLERLGRGLNAPFRQHLGPSLTTPLRSASRWKAYPVLLFAAFLALVATTAIYFYPGRRVSPPASALISPILASATSAEKSVKPAVPQPTALRIQVSEAVWISVSDAQGQRLLARELAAGEEVELDGAPPLHIQLGNVSAAQIFLRGQPIDLSAYAPNQSAELDVR